MKTAAAMIIAMALLSTSPAHAHKLGVYAWPEDGEIIAEGYYMDGAPCAGCILEVFDGATGALIKNSPTDPRGLLHFRSTAKKIRLVLTAPGGHRVEQVVELGESDMEKGKALKKDTSPSAIRIIIGFNLIVFIALIWAYIKSRRKLL